MTIWFDRPIGPHADVNELEYVAALHQSVMPDLRPNGSLYAKDIVHYLMSRHGIRTTVDVIQEHILNGLAGNIDSQHPPILDIAQIATILLIPLLRRRAMEAAEVLVAAEEVAKNDDQDGDNKQTQQLQINKGDDDDELPFFHQVHSLFHLLQAAFVADNTKHNYTQDDNPQQPVWLLTPSILQTLLEEHGEYDVSPQMIQDMMAHAAKAAAAAAAITTTTGSTCSNSRVQPQQQLQHQHERTELVVMTVETLMQVLTCDLNVYDPSRELVLSTHMQDAMETTTTGKTSVTSVASTKEVVKNNETKPNNDVEVVDTEHVVVSDDDKAEQQCDVEETILSRVEDDAHPDQHEPSSPPPPLLFDRVYTAPYIDHVADTFTSPAWVVLVWLLLILLYIAYLSNTSGGGSIDCKENDTLRPFSCHVVNGIITWIIIFLQLSILGVLFVTLMSLGNSAKYDTVNIVNNNNNKSREVAKLAVAIITTFVTCILSYIFEVKTFAFNTNKKQVLTPLYIGILLLGLLLMAIQFIELLRVLFGKQLFQHMPPWLQRCSTSGSIRMESCMKSAAVFKVNRMMRNALDIHDIHNKKTSGGMIPKINNSMVGAASVSASSSSIAAFRRHKNALLQFQLLENQTQPAGGVLWGWKKVWNGSLFTEEGVWLHARLLACNLVQLIITVGVFVAWILCLFLFRLEGENVQDVKKQVTLAEVDVALTLGALSAVAACAGITVVFIPSFISTCIQFRTGVIPSLKSNSFRVYRFSEDNTALLFGGCFWGILSTAIVCWALVGAVSFITVWHKTRDIVLIIISNILGWGITYLIKIGVLLLLRHYLYRAFYRQRTALANYVTLALECWNLALTSGFILVRTSKLLLVTAFYLGRIDTPVLAPGVGVVGPLIFDGYPVIFRKDLLAHDAHRHPLLERLGMLYTMKLLHGDAFACRAGSCWRLLMVLVIMPWLRKYRIHRSDTAAIHHSSLDEVIMEEQPVVLDDDDKQVPRRDKSMMLLDPSSSSSMNEREMDREVESLRRRLHLQEEENEQLKAQLLMATTQYAE